MQYDLFFFKVRVIHFDLRFLHVFLYYKINYYQSNYFFFVKNEKPELNKK